MKSKKCSNCGADFTCGPTFGEQGCWCEALPRASLVADGDQDCLCPACLSEAIARLPKPGAHIFNSAMTSPPALVEGEDYYCEGPAIVFTARYLLRRGYCCESGCRHCPYESGQPVSQRSAKQKREVVEVPLPPRDAHGSDSDDDQNAHERRSRVL